MRVLIFVAAAAVSSSAALAQAPPVKMGLWETVSVTTMQMPPAMAQKMAGVGMANGAPRTDTTQTCITPESWQKALAHTNTRGDCTYTDKTITATGMTFAMTCAAGGMTTKANGKVTFDSSEKATSTFRLEMQMPSMPGGGAMITESKGTMRFVSADCGSVKPYMEPPPRR